MRIAIDDVAAEGGANVAVLARAAFDIVKLDRHLVAQIVADCPHPAWLDEMSALVQLSRLHLVAEGVENELQCATLRAAGIPTARGSTSRAARRGRPLSFTAAPRPARRRQTRAPQPVTAPGATTTPAPQAMVQTRGACRRTRTPSRRVGAARRSRSGGEWQVRTGDSTAARAG